MNGLLVRPTRTGRLVALAVAVLALLPATVASAAAGTAAPAAGSAHLYLDGVFFLGRAPVTVPKRSFQVSGLVRPYVPGQWVRVTASLDGKPFGHVKLRVKPSPRGLFGRFSWRFASPAVGNVTVRAVHPASAEQRAFRAGRGVAALSESVGFGSNGRFVQLIQQRLAALHFYLPQSGVYDEQTGLAVDAYHRMLGWGTSQLLGPATVGALLGGAGGFHVRFPNQGRHAEGDLSDQLLALIDGSQVQLIFPISSGKPSTPTVLGQYRVYSRVPGYLPDGMYFSDFFTGGYAIHGYNPAPDYPASHGCMRMPISDAIAAFDWLAIGDGVDVYYS